MPKYPGFETRANLPARQCAQQPAADGPWPLACEKVTSRMGLGVLCVLIGPRGTGKTRIAVEAARHHFAANALLSPPAHMDRPVHYLTAMELFLKLKATFGAKAPTAEADVIQTWVRAPLLIVDEIQERAETPWEDRILTNIIDRRYSAMRDTILIGNMTEAEVVKALGPSISDRAAEAGGIMVCDWPSFRGAK